MEHIEECKPMMECDQQKESKKSTKVEYEKTLSKEFSRALSLLFSPEANSAEELRMMLETEIAKQNKLKHPKLQTSRGRSKRRKTIVEAVKNECSVPEKKMKGNYGNSGKKFDVASDRKPDAVEEAGSRDDFPRISIPDEDQSDGAVCKVCNVPEFGPLTLLQCHICEKYYHPSCHQPPIIDLCFQEPNSLWHCGECGKNN